MKYVRQTTDACKSLKYESKKYPYIYGKQGCVYTSGCGLCSTKVMYEALLGKTIDTKSWRDVMYKINARVNAGTDINIVGKYLNKEYGVDFYSTTKIDDVVNILKTGKGKVVAHVGANNIFSSDGHYISVIGIRKDNKLICYDSYWYDGKFSKSPRTCVEVEKDGRELYISKDNLYKDTKGERFYVFIPKSKDKIKYSSNDVNYNKKETVVYKNKPSIKIGQKVTLTNVRGVYYGCGDNTGLKKVNELTTDGEKNATSTKAKAKAYFKAGTNLTVVDQGISKSGNLWIKGFSGWMCIWEKKTDKKYIK